MNLRILSAATTAVALAGATISMMAPMALAQSGGPTVTLTSTSSATTTSATIPVAVAFSAAVTGFTSSDVTVTNGTVGNFAGSGASYTFDVTATATGTVTVMVAADVATETGPPNKTNQASNTLTFTYTTADTTAPNITNVNVTPSQTGATITWDTNEAATGQVSYGTTLAYSSTSTMETVATTTHSATLTGLTASTTYHYSISATDASSNTGNTPDATFTTTASTPAAPVISGVNASATGTSTATVTWSTDVAASSQVFYGTTTSYGSSTTLDTTASTTHSVMLTGLTEATLYHAQASSGNGTGTTTSSDVTFTTNSSASTTPLAVTGVDSVKTNATADDTYVHGFEWVLHLTVPDTEDAFRMKFSNFLRTGGGGTITTANHVRLFSPQSSNASSEESAITETDTNYGGWLYLNGDTATSTAGRQVDVTVEVRVPSGTPNGSYTTTYGAQSVPSNATSTTPL